MPPISLADFYGVAGIMISLTLYRTSWIGVVVHQQYTARCARPEVGKRLVGKIIFRGEGIVQAKAHRANHDTPNKGDLFIYAHAYFLLLNGAAFCSNRLLQVNTSISESSKSASFVNKTQSFRRHKSAICRSFQSFSPDEKSSSIAIMSLSAKLSFTLLMLGISSISLTHSAALSAIGLYVSKSCIRKSLNVRLD